MNPSEESKKNELISFFGCFICIFDARVENKVRFLKNSYFNVHFETIKTI